MKKKVEKNEIQNGISRRDFLKKTAVVTTASVGVGILSACAPKVVETAAPAGETAASSTTPCTQWSWETVPAAIPASDIKETVDTDVLVIGAGLAGLCASIAAAEEGAKVIIIDKNEVVAARGGHITAFGSKLQKEMGIEVNYRQVIREWVRWSQGKLDEDLLWLFGHKSGPCMDWTMDLVKPQGIGTALWSEFYSGPDYTEYPVTHFFTKVGGDTTYANGVATGVGNSLLVAGLEKVAQEKGVQFDFSTPAVQFVRDGNGPVTGVIAGVEGAYKQYNAKGIVIATGDYASNTEMVTKYAPYALDADAQIYLPNKCNTGDVHIMAMHAGGVMQKQEPHAAVIHLEAGAASYGFMHVNALGERFKNEDVNTQSKSCTKELEPGGIAWTVYDADGLSQVKEQVDKRIAGGLFYGQTFASGENAFDLEAEKKTLEQHIKDGKVVTADTIEDLAAKMEVPVETFVATVNRYNEIVDMGDDVDYGKRKELLTPIVKPPFYAGKLISTILTMVGGLHTDTSLHVLDKDNNPIEGLYVAGSAAGDFFANDYPTLCPGIGHGRCLTFGRMAGMLAAGGDISTIPDTAI